MSPAERGGRNRTLNLSGAELESYKANLFAVQHPVSVPEFENRVICGDMKRVLRFLPDSFVDLLILDPPYNLDKKFNGTDFHASTSANYLEYLESWFPELLRLLKPEASVYLCGDWRCSAADFLILEKYLNVRTRITWQREKGRASKTNWKNCSEDIWFATAGKNWKFYPDRVRQMKRVIAPYRSADGSPRGWENTEDGNFRLTGASNFWDDISVPFWSMPENTDHPTQKPEKLLAKLILAGTDPGDFVFDPFSGSGSTLVTAKKLGRRFAGIELDPLYCCWTAARLDRAGKDASIQGYSDGIFWERNSAPTKKKIRPAEKRKKHDEENRIWD